MTKRIPITWTDCTVHLGDLKPWSDNPKTTSKKDARKLIESLDELGQFQNVSIGPDNEVFDGHQRLSAWLTIYGAGFEVAARRASRPLTDEERRMIAIYSRQIGAWDWDKLANWDGEQLVSWGMDGDLLQDWKRDIAGLSALVESTKEPPPDDPGDQTSRADELQEKWQVKTGDLWVIGDHRLVCGDCTDRAVVERVMGGEKARLVFTSPPYWVGMAYETQKSEEEIDRFIHDCVACWTEFVGVDFGRICINTGSAAIHRIEKKRRVEVLPLIDKWQAELKQRGWLARHWRIWAKGGDFPASISARADVVDQHWENIVTFDNDFSFLGTWWSPAGEQSGQEKIGTPWAQQGVWSDIQGERGSNGHIAAFPIELPKRNIMLYSESGQTVFEPFAGSGTTIVACEQLHRKARAVEISPAYCSVILERLSLMGLTPAKIEAR